MQYTGEKKFSFISDALPESAFGVVKFSGTEGLSRLYEFEILVVSERLDIPLEDVIQKNVRLIIHRNEGEDAVFQGMPIEFDQLQAVDGLGFYQVRLAPKLWRLSLIRNNQILLDQALPDFVTEILRDGGLTTLDFEFRLQGNYPPREFICQYGESHLDFVSRWLEREGIYYFFEQGDSGEKVIFTDTAIAHRDLPQGKTITYHPASGLETARRDEVIGKFLCRQRLTPEKVFVKEYNEMKPSLDISGSAPVAKDGFGQVYYYHENFQTPEEGNHLAKIRAEAILCREKEFRGESFIPYLAPGFSFELQEHFRSDYNARYLVTEVRHQGNQAGYITAGFGNSMSEREKTTFYQNEFAAIPVDIQFRPERTTPRPRISGAISAHIDAEGSGKYAELDDHGRYHILLPFDLAGRPGGKASAWVRMAQPYVGSDHGMHFPLHKGTEVLLTFIDGDPDRPVIAAAIPNTENRSVVGSGNAAQAGFTTAGGSGIRTDDTEGRESLVMRAGGEDGPVLGMLPGATISDARYKFDIATTAEIQTLTGLQTAMSMFKKTSTTGFAFIQVWSSLLTSLVKEQGKSLWETKNERKGTKEDVSTLEKVIGYGVPAVFLFLECLKKYLVEFKLKKGLLSSITRPDVPRWAEILEETGFRVFCGDGGKFGSGTIVEEGWYNPLKGAKGKSISMASVEGPVFTYSGEDTHIVAEQNINIKAMGTEHGVVDSKRSIQIDGQANVEFRSLAGDVLIMTEAALKRVRMENIPANSFFEAGADAATMRKGKEFETDGDAATMRKGKKDEGSSVTCTTYNVEIQKTGGASICVDRDITMANKEGNNPDSTLTLTNNHAHISYGKNNNITLCKNDGGWVFGDSKIRLSDLGIEMKWKGTGKLGRNMKIDEKSGKITMG